MSKKVTDQLRAAITSSGKSGNEIAKESGVPQSTLVRFLAGNEVRSAHIDTLARYFGLSLKADRPKRSK